jgi:hypothetical protein
MKRLQNKATLTPKKGSKQCGKTVPIEEYRRMLPVISRNPACASNVRCLKDPCQHTCQVGAKSCETWKERLGGIDPVVGWLVCIEGPDRGRDYRIHTERNFIGRAPTMDIAITGDPAISWDNQAVLSYNPRRHTFRLAPGTVAALSISTTRR